MRQHASLEEPYPMAGGVGNELDLWFSSPAGRQGVKETGLQLPI